MLIPNRICLSQRANRLSHRGDAVISNKLECERVSELTLRYIFGGKRALVHIEFALMSAVNFIYLSESLTSDTDIIVPTRMSSFSKPSILINSFIGTSFILLSFKRYCCDSLTLCIGDPVLRDTTTFACIMATVLLIPAFILAADSFGKNS